MTCPRCKKDVEGTPLQCPHCGKILRSEGIKMIQREYEYIEKKGFKAYRLMWKSLLDFLGKSTRKEFFHALVIHGFIILVLEFVLGPLFRLINLDFLTEGFLFIKNTFMIVSVVPVYNLLLRRARDAGMNPAFGFGILVFLFNIAFLSIIIGNLNSAHESIRGVIFNPFPYLAFITSNTSMMPHSEMVMGFLKFVTALNVVLLGINIALVLSATLFKTKIVKRYEKAIPQVSPSNG